MIGEIRLVFQGSPGVATEGVDYGVVGGFVDDVLVVASGEGLAVGECAEDEGVDVDEDTHVVGVGEADGGRGVSCGLFPDRRVGRGWLRLCIAWTKGFSELKGRIGGTADDR